MPLLHGVVHEVTQTRAAPVIPQSIVTPKRDSRSVD